MRPHKHAMTLALRAKSSAAPGRPCGAAGRLAIALCVGLLAQMPAAAIDNNALIDRYEALLLLDRGDYLKSRAARKVFDDFLLRQFEAAIDEAQSYPFDLRGLPANYSRARDDAASVGPAQNQQDANDRFYRLFASTLPLLAYAYRTPGPSPGRNPYHRNSDVARLYAYALEYCYSRGLTELAWTPDHAGRASGRALRRGLARKSGDFSRVSLRLGGFIQSVFLMRKPLAEMGLLDRYRKVARNLAINNGTLHGAFFQHARAEAGINYPDPLPQESRFHLNADGIRLFVDYFIPYFLLIKDLGEHRDMAEVLRQVIAVNVATRPGAQGTIKPDGSGFHHGAAYVGAYTPYTFESFAQLLHLLRGTDFQTPENVEALKLALRSFRFMVQKYSVTSALRGRLIEGDGSSAAAAVTRAMALLAHPGIGDKEMLARFNEFFDPDYFFAKGRLREYHMGQRGVPIRGLGIYRLVGEILDAQEAAAVPSGVEIKPYAAAAFFRRSHWLVTAKGFSRYLWDYEGPLEKRQNSFGQNWSYGLLQVFSAGDPISERGSGHDLENGWDWYHMPGTTASHYPIERRAYSDVAEARSRAGIRWPDPQRNYNSRTYVGGVTLGDHGFFVQDLEAAPFTAPTDLKARKSYFFVGDKALALGTRISGGTADDATHTTLFQTSLQSGNHPGSINGRAGSKSQAVEVRIPPGSPVPLTDSVGNSYFLAESSADLVFSRGRQRSLTPRHQPTSGHFVTAYLDHGIKPQGDHYAYALIPSDSGESGLQALAADPGAYFRIIESERMHLVHFPEWRITAYAFYEAIETPKGQRVRSANLPAAVIVQEQDGKLRLAASVPDLGWDSNDRQLHRGLAYGSRHYATQSAKTHRLTLVLRGGWTLAEPEAGANAETRGGDTIVEIICRDGLSRQLALRPIARSGQDASAGS